MKIDLEQTTIEELANWIAQQPITAPDNGLVIKWPQYLKYSGKYSRCSAYLSSGPGGVGTWLKTRYKDHETNYVAYGDSVKDVLIKLATIIMKGSNET